MKRLLSLIKPHWRLVLLGALAGGIVAGMNGALAWVVKDVVDDIFIAGDKRILVFISIGVLGAFWIRGLFLAAQNRVVSQNRCYRDDCWWSLPQIPAVP